MRKDKDWETFSLQGKAARGFSSLCLQDGSFLIVSLSAFVGRKDSEKNEDSIRRFIVSRQKIIEKSEPLTNTGKDWEQYSHQNAKP